MLFCIYFSAKLEENFKNLVNKTLEFSQTISVTTKTPTTTTQENNLQLETKLADWQNFPSVSDDEQISSKERLTEEYVTIRSPTI